MRHGSLRNNKGPLGALCIPAAKVAASRYFFLPPSSADTRPAGRRAVSAGSESGCFHVFADGRIGGTRLVRLREEVVHWRPGCRPARCAAAGAAIAAVATATSFATITRLATVPALAPVALRALPRPLDPGQRADLELLLRQPLDARHGAIVRSGHQHDGQAARAGTTRAADAMHVVLGLERHVVVDDDRQFDDVESPRRDVGGDEHLDRAVLEALERLHALVLRLVAVDRVRVDACLLQLPREAAALDLRVDEDQHLGQAATIGPARAQDLEQRVGLLRLVQLVDLLLDVVGGGVARRGLDQLRTAQEVRGELLDFLGKRRREHQALPFLRQEIEDARDVRQEPHVQHAVRLVEHDDLHLRQAGVLLLDVIEQPSRRGDHHLASAAQRLGLRFHVDAAVDDRDAQRRLRRVLLHVFRGLVGQFAGGLEDESADRVTRRRHARIGVRHQPLQHRQAEARRLAGAGLGRAHHVAAAQHHRNRLRLDRRRRRVTHLGDRSEQLRVEAEVREVFWVGHQRGRASARKVATGAGIRRGVVGPPGVEPGTDGL